MEFLEGKTLKHVIAGRPIELETLLDVAIYMAEGLLARPWAAPPSRASRAEN
jgi:hypothetical protein